MCGITGWISFNRDLARRRDVVDAMTQTMACRGPDASGTWISGPAALGHRRLAVIDLQGGVQPMSVRTPEGEVVLVYSGEAYNYTDLREELRRAGEQFETSSDTEVVLRGYLRWGEGVAARLNGMFAFAIWDDRTRKLVMIRDRMGIKPLYVYPTSDGVLFGSSKAHKELRKVLVEGGQSTTPADESPPPRPHVPREYNPELDFTKDSDPKS